MLMEDFRRQLTALRERYEMATLESALAFLAGTFMPRRDLCLLTFDDGLREHYVDVVPLLVEHGIQGTFFVITSCVQDRRVASVHMNHFLMAVQGIDRYQAAFVGRLRDAAPHAWHEDAGISDIAQRTYRWDSQQVASFKYLFNFVIDWKIRDQVLRSLFEDEIATEAQFSQDLYFNWREAQQMQAAGMVVGGHSHQHRPLATLSADELADDLQTCQRLLLEQLRPQAIWPFCYPYGKHESFTRAAVGLLQRLDFTCAFSTEVGANQPYGDVFALRRVDCKDAPRGTDTP